MYRNFINKIGIPDRLYHKIMLIMRFTTVILIASLMQVNAATFGQRITLNKTKASLFSVLKDIRKQSGFGFYYDENTITQSQKVSVSVLNASIEETLEKTLRGLNLSYEINGNTISIAVKVNRQNGVKVIADSVITGKVTDAVTKQPLSSVTVTNLTTKRTVQTDARGEYAIRANRGHLLQFTAIGRKSKNVTVSDAQIISVSLDESVSMLQDIVINTGIYTRNKENFTGSSATYTQKELKQAGGTNILQSLKTMDPAFAIIENPLAGSNPNALPNLEIRGKSSILGTRDELSVDPNQPLFILDGFESTLAAINDLDINRIESITLLKDAASTAIYGSKAANGVVVVETVKPKAGKLQVTYNGNVNISAPDLTSYNMMNASEKLEFELLAGRYDPNLVETANRTETEIRLGLLYNNRLRSIAEGVDSYWLAEPLRTGISQKHSLYMMGGEGNFSFGLGGGYNGVTGAMKESKRNVTNGNIDLTYRVSKFQFSNKFTVSKTDMRNPIVNFSEYANANPYYRKTNNDGQVGQWLENNTTVQVGNPIWNASLMSRNMGKNMSLTNFFASEWFPSAAWRVRVRFGLTYDNNDTERFLSPQDSRQIANKEVNKRGEFSSSNLRGNKYEGDATVSWAKLINRHRINLVGGANVTNNQTVSEGYRVEGFPEGNFTYPNFALGYPENSLPDYAESTSRSLNGYFNAGYSFDDRYLVDVSLRSSGSSIFGNARHFNTTWSVGAGWNIHREKFISENAKWINFLKLRSSVGNPGNQNFESGRTLITYAFNNGLQSYFGMGVRPYQIGNPNLQWQLTNDKNIGIDLTAFNRRFNFTVDYFHKVTNPLLIAIDMPLSSGTSQYFTNAGEQVSKGMTLSTSYFIFQNLQRRIMWSVRLNGRTQTSRIDNIGNKLDVFNNSGRGTSTTRYFDGADPDDIWVVRSLGIDPSTGKELFLDKDGNFTYDFSYNNEVIVGNRRPDIEGIMGSSLTLGGFTVNLNFRYQYGAEIFNTALRSKVENANFTLNQDRRALYERWHKAGDIRAFKDIRDVNPSPLSSRFVQREKNIVLESVYAEYQFTNGWIKKQGLGNLRVFASMRDVFRISSIRAERGIEYPFAKVFDGGLSFNF